MHSTQGGGRSNVPPLAAASARTERRVAQCMMLIMFYAHSTSDPSQTDWQKLSDHLQSVAKLAGQHGEWSGVAKAAALAGLLHDLGKYTAEFQARLKGSPERVDHSTAGAWQVMRLASGNDDKVVSELIAYAIAGHHAGLPDRIGASGSLDERLGRFDHPKLDLVWRQEIAPDASGLMRKFDLGDKTTAPFRVGFLGRMIFSCLVDADYKDTEAFYNRVEGRIANRDWGSLQELLPDFITAFDRYIARMPKTATKVNQLRGEILAAVRAHAADPTGLFTLTVPTGGGKTLASLGFALDHARNHGLRRIIYAIPFTSIIDQTADIFRAVLGPEQILEHHSAIEEDQFTGREQREQRDKLKLAMEDWAAPVVVTTNVQFFESLFAARPSRCRKLHNIAGSVIILDEAQTLPRPFLAPCVRVLDELARNYGCSIVLCTATQPALDKRNFPREHPMGLPLADRELAPDPHRLAAELRRVTIRSGTAMDNRDLAEALADTDQGLIIVNSRRHALDLFQEAREQGIDGLFHLTTRQYANHRREILAKIRQHLKNEQPCRVIATSLVEAGVDLDFPRVWRAEAGLDQIAQAAGRCNREGKRPPEQSIVTVFSAPDYSPPREIRGLSGDLARIAARHGDLLSLAALEDFFGEVYWRLGDALDREKILALFAQDRTGTNFAYRSTAEKFRMIESGMVPVIIGRDEKAQETIRKLSVERIPSGTIARELQSFVVQVPPKACRSLVACGHVRFLEEDLRGDQFAVLQTPSLYTEETGLFWDDAEYLALENTIL
jgi:CRISPR-associated endonuclease/helicase Cas3